LTDEIEALQLEYQTSLVAPRVCPGVSRRAFDGSGYSWSSWSNLLGPEVTLSSYSAVFHSLLNGLLTTPTVVKRAARLVSCLNACYRCRPRLLKLGGDVFRTGDIPAENASTKSPITMPSLQRVKVRYGHKRGMAESTESVGS
jgi:hypothetical protein